jgi:hypothetical protein
MKHPVRNDFDPALTEAGVNITFKPTNSIYSFYRLPEREDVARLGPVSLGPVRRAGPSYPKDNGKGYEIVGHLRYVRVEEGPKVPA